MIYFPHSLGEICNFMKTEEIIVSKLYVLIKYRIFPQNYFPIKTKDLITHLIYNFVASNHLTVTHYLHVGIAMNQRHEHSC